MDEVSFTDVLGAALEKDYISPAEKDGEFKGIYRAALVSDFYKRLPGLAQTTFSSYSAFIRRFHQEIRSVLQVAVTPLLDDTSLRIGDDPPECAYGFDSITNEPMGIGYQVWLETNKPLQLRPDTCSWTTYLRFEDLLRGEVLGRLDEDLSKNRDAIAGSLH